MAKITYEIKPVAGGWAILRDGEPGAEYATAEGAFEVVASQTSIELRSDNEIVITIRAPAKRSSP